MNLSIITYSGYDRRTDEISALEVEAVELVASRFGIHYVFIDNERCALGIAGDALTDLAIERQQVGERERGHIDVPHRAKFAEEVEELLCSDVEAEHRLVVKRACWWHLTCLRFFTKRAL